MLFLFFVFAPISVYKFCIFVDKHDALSLKFVKRKKFAHAASSFFVATKLKYDIIYVYKLLLLFGSPAEEE